jgi:agmatine deiminase
MTLRQPAEWDKHDAVWAAWPLHEDLWQEHLPAVQVEFVAMCRAIQHGSNAERLEVLVGDAAHESAARSPLAGLSVRFHRIPFGDIWLRDSAPIFVRDAQRGLTAVRFKFNGWGGKYELQHDAQVSERVAYASKLPTVAFPFVLEGGAVDVDGLGTLLTTESCLLNPNRGPVQTKAAIEARLHETLGAQKVIWIRDGLLNDHTDGHVDTIARFVAPGVVVCMQPSGGDDPNRDVLLEIADTLRSATDAAGKPLTVRTIPSPGLVQSSEDDVMPASYVNFYIANHSVVVPTYGTPHDAPSVAGIQALFPSRKVIGSSAKMILEGGGAFHCITQQQPAALGT